MKFSFESIYRKLYLWIGVVCTGSALSVGVGSAKMSVFNFLLLFSFVLRLIHIAVNKEGLYVLKKMYVWYLFGFVLMLSACGALLCVPRSWFINSLMLTGKLLLYFGGIIILFPKILLYKIKDDFFRGLYYGCIGQLVYGIFQGLLWYGFSINLNEIVFGRILNAGSEDIMWDNNILGGIVMRFTGFSWEPANFALVMLIGIILAKTVKMRLLFIMMIVFSYSKTGILTLLLLALVYIMSIIKGIVFKEHFSIKLIKAYTVIIALVVLSLLAVVEYDKLLYVYRLVENILENLYIAIMTEESLSGNIHKMYYLAVLDVIEKGNIWEFLFGYGTFSAGYPYALYDIIPYGIKKAWNPETDFITLLIGNGIVGVLVYYGIVLQNLFCIKDYKYRYILLAILSCGITYLYARGTWTLLILLFISIERMEQNEKNNVSIEC